MSHTNHHHRTHAILLVSALLLAGCANQRERAIAAQAPGQAGAYAPAEEPSATTPQSQQAEGEPRTQLYADLALLAACGMEAPTVYFEYDSANVRRAAEVGLSEIAECMQRPPMADLQLEVIGHTDERGTEEYNQSLGMRRANAVVDELVTAGLDRTRVRAHSMGEQQATTPASWDDRRVVIRLVDEGQAQPESETVPNSPMGKKP
jgi:outer membrane protein OmpA-like peptidoglycan-associated protein